MSAQEEVSSQETDTQSVLSGLSQPPFPPNSILDRAEFLDKVIGVKIKAHHLENFYHELHQQAYPEMGEFVGTYQFNRRGKEHEDEEPLPESLLAFLMDSRNPCVTMASTIQKVTSSASGKSVKLDVKLHDGKLVETMITRVSDKGKHVASVSISSQVGCSVGGAYSPSTDFVRDLSASEMIEQVIHAMRELQKEEPSHVIRKVAFTGGGEPLLNYDPVVAACRFIADSFKLGRGCITIATVGITPRIFDLTRDLPDVNLCLRLYAPNQELRSAILPVSSRFGLAGIFEALDHHMTTNKHQLAVENHEMLSRKRRVMIEYLMVEGKTSKLACAHELGKLCSRRDLVVTLVPFIKASKDEKLRCSSVKSINEFKATVASYGVQCAVRLSAGSDIRYSVVLKTEAETQLLSESGTGAERSEFWKELDSVKKESRIKRRQTRKMADEDESSMASDIAPVALEQTAFNVLLAGHGGSDRYEMGIESLELDASDEDLPEMFLSSSQELNMVLSGGMLFEDSFDDLCEIDPALDVSPSKNSLRARDRTIPSPNSLLDRVSFLDGLEDAEIHVSMPEIDAFYKALHQMDYPPIDEFIQLYDDSGKTAATMAETRRLMVPPEVLKFALDPLNGFVTMSTKIHSSKKSVDSQSFRLYIQLQDEYVVETMVMRYAVDDKQYASISVSTQVSSPIGLSGNFNLQTSEIVEQIVHASRTLALNREMGQPAEIIGKVSFLGCGEPLLNYDNLVDACFFMAEKPMWNINKDRMTVSTIGITPRIFDLTRDLPQVNIALDLRAPTQNLRSAVVPLAQRYSLDGLMEALDNHMRKYTVSDRTSILDNDTRREKVIIVYTMVQGETSKLEHAHELGKLCQLHNLGVNLIPYIRRSKEDKGKCPSMRHINEFKEVVLSYSVVCSVKLSLGAKVQDPKKQFVVQAERSNSAKASSVRIKYRDNSRSQIDFWETLAVVKRESIRKRRKSRELKSQEGRAVNWSEDNIMVASFSDGLVSFAPVGCSMGMFGSDVTAEEIAPIVQMEDGSLQRSALLVENSAFAFSPSTSATESLNQEGDESVDDHYASNVEYDFSEEGDFAVECKNESEDTLTYVSAPTSTSRIIVAKTENAPSGDGVAKAAVVGGAVAALSIVSVATKDTPGEDDSTPASRKYEIQENGEESASDIVPKADANDVSQVATESREGSDSGASTAITGGVAGVASITMLRSEGGGEGENCGSGDISIPGCVDEKSQSNVKEIVHDEEVSQLKLERHKLGSGVAAAVIAGRVVGTSLLAALASKSSDKEDYSAAESADTSLQESTEEASISVIATVDTDDALQKGRGSDRQTPAHDPVTQATLELIGTVLKSEINDDDDFELSAELMDEIQSAGGDDFTFSLAIVDHSTNLDMLAMQQTMMAHIENTESEDDIEDPFCLYTIDEHDIEDDNSEYAKTGTHSGKRALASNEKVSIPDPNFDSATLKDESNEVNEGAPKESNGLLPSGTLEERLQEAESARAELDTSNRFLLSQMEQIALQANEELTAQIEQSEAFRQQMLEAQTLQRRAEAEREELKKKVSELQLNDDSELLKERDELRERLSVLQFEHNELRAENMRLDNGHTNGLSRSLQSKDNGAPQKSLADALEEIKNVQQENARLLRESDERSYEKEEELLEILREKDQMQKAFREAAKSLILKEERLASALAETRRMEQENAELALDNSPQSLGKDEELLEIMWKENDDLQKALGEAIACINEKEEEIERFEASMEEILHRRMHEKIALEKAPKEAAQAVHKKEEKLAELATLAKERASENEEEVESLLLKNLALEQHLAAAYRFTAPSFEPTEQLSEQIEYLEARISEFEVANAFLETNIKQLQSSLSISKALTKNLSSEEVQKFDMQTMQEQNDELRALCEKLEREKTEIVAAAAKEEASASEKCRLVADMATAHLTGRLGLEARLQACEKVRHEITLDNEFMTARMEVVDLTSVTEIQSLKAQVQHIRLMLTDARNQQTRAEEENIMLELEQVMSDSESIASSRVSDIEFEDSSRGSSFH